MSSSRPRQGLTARAYAAVVVGLRHIIPLAWIAAAVAATVALPGLGNAPAAPLDDLAAKGGSAAKAQALATSTFGFPLATDTAVVQRDPRGLSEDAQRRQLDAALAVRDRRDPALEAASGGHPAEQREAAHAVGRARHDRHHLPALRARHEPRRRGRRGAALRPADARRPARRGRRRHRRGARARGAVPRDRAGAAAHRGRQRGAHRPHRGSRLPLDRRPARGAGGRRHRLRDSHAGAPVAGRARRRHGAQGDRAGRRRAPARARHRLLDLLPVRDAPPAARGRRAAARRTGSGRRGRADRRHRRPDRGRGDRRAGRRPPAVLPRLRPRPGRHDAHHPRRLDHARSRPRGAVRPAAVRRPAAARAAPAAAGGRRGANGAGPAASSRCA